MTARAQLLLTLGGLLLAGLLGVMWLLQSADEPPLISPRTGGAVGADSELEEPRLPVTEAGARALPSTVSKSAVEPLASAALSTVVSGRVVDRSGRAVSGALVTPFESRPAPPFRSRRDVRPGEITDGEGRFQFLALPVGVPLGVEVEHADYAPLTREVFELRLDQALDLGDLLLDKGFALFGTVSAPDGTPLAEAVVQLNDVTTTLRGAVSVRRQVITDSSGQYLHEHLAPRQYDVEVALPGFAAQSVLLSLALGGAAGRFRQDFQLAPADSRIEGLILGPDDLPVAFARLRLLRREPGSQSLVSRSTSSDAQGQFVFEDLGAGRYELSAEGDRHYLPQSQSVSSEEGLITLRMQALQEVLLRLSATGPLPTRFTLRTLPDGRTGAALPPGAPAQSTLELSDASGEVLIAGLRPGSYRFEIRAAGFAPSRTSDVILGPETLRAEVLLELQLGGTIEGRIEPPLEGAAIELRELDYDPALVLESVFPTEPVHGLVTESDPEGDFRLEHVPAGSYTLTARVAGAPAKHLRDVLVAEGRTTDVGVLEFETGGEITGQVFGTDGRPSANVRISALTLGHQAQATTDSEGRFRLAALPPGDYELSAAPSGLFEALRFAAQAWVTLRGGESKDVSLVLQERVR
ncbi:MAG: carboxypeptidase regulatory-like domain-containing protein [Planctomycetota bacterium]